MMYGYLFPILLSTIFVFSCASSPDQVTVCMPCSKSYISNSILNSEISNPKYASTEESRSTNLCSGQSINENLLELELELFRSLDGEGSHRRLVSELKFKNCESTILPLLDAYHCELVVIERLPIGVFSDPFELQRLVKRKVYLDVGVFGDTNLELPSALSDRSTVEIHIDLIHSVSLKEYCKISIELPLHARYPPLINTSAYATVEITSPDMYTRCRLKDLNSDTCQWGIEVLNAGPTEILKWFVPCGNEQHERFVSIFTFLSAIVCSLSIVLATVFYRPKNC